MPQLTIISDLDILIAAEEAATRVLRETRQEAARHQGLGQVAADKLLLQQHEAAERLLQEQREQAAATAQEARRAVEAAPPEDRQNILDEVNRRVEQLLDAQFAAAEALLTSEREEADRSHRALEHRVAEVLMRGHREAAGILLHARMTIEDRRRVRGKS